MSGIQEMDHLRERLRTAAGMLRDLRPHLRAHGEVTDVGPLRTALGIMAGEMELAADLLPYTQALLDVHAERARQVTEERFDQKHDDEHGDGSLALAAACYAMFASVSDEQRATTDMPAALTTSRKTIKGWSAFLELWPWDREWWKPKDKRRDLVRAAALLLAEIERVDRLAVRRKSN